MFLNLFSFSFNIKRLAFLMLVLSVFIAACSTRKDTWTRRQYHSLTAHYNAYFNGQTTLKETKLNIAKNHKDNYSEILDIFPLGTSESVKAESMKFDRIMEKASFVVHKHSMVFNGHEKNPWIPKSYFMMGQARFFAHEYGLSKQTFKFVINKYPKEPVKFDAQLWIARVQVIEGEYDEARGSLGALENAYKSGMASVEFTLLYPMIYADLYLKQKNYSAAIPFLKEAIKVNKKKSVRARLYFILGQLHQNLNQFDDAIDAYKMVLKNNPVYELDFNSRINMAECYQGNDSDSKDIISQLLKMTKDEKNIDYLDQIYFALASVELKNKNEKKAIEYLELSVLKSTSNNLQKAFSALKLADIYFEKTDYTHAQAYYDSTVLFLPKTYPDYQTLKDRKDILTELVRHILIVQNQDSLLQLAKLSDSERNKVIDGIIKGVIAEEQRKQEEERIRQESLQFMEENRMTTQSVTQTKTQKFYFYNPQTLSYGFTEFQKKWGQRKLEDNWRLSSKQTVEFGMEGEFEDQQNAVNDSIKKLSSDKKNRAYYLKDIPLTPALQDTSHKKISAALYNMGFIYKEKLNNPAKATESFEELLKRYPATKYTPASYYFLYQLFNAAQNEGDADFYKKNLIKEYPESDYAKLVLDPQYYKKLQADSEKARQLYDLAYRNFQSGLYSKTIEMAAEASTKYPSETPILAQFALLKALSLGKVSDTVSFREALHQVVSEFGGTEQARLASLILQRMNEGQKMSASKDSASNTSTPEEKPAQPAIFSDDKSSTHMFIVIIDRKDTKSMEVQQNLSVHNDKFFATDRLTVSAIPLDANMIIVGVSNFKTAADAVIYFNTIKRNPESAKILTKSKGNFFIISQENYTRLYKTRNLEAYKIFHGENFPEIN